MVRVVDFWAFNENGDEDAGIELKVNDGLTRTAPSLGVFAQYPAATPKWAGRGGAAENDYRNTMARMFIELDANEREKFLSSVDLSAPDAHSGEDRILASVLAGPPDAKTGTGYIDFLLQDVQMPFEEKVQVVETLADNYVIYYFGQAAVPFTFAGTVLNTVEDDQAVNMLRIYRDMIRGTQLARRRKLLRIRFNGMIVAGSVLSLHLGLGAESEMSLAFSMQVMPKTVSLLPNPDFGVVVLGEGADRTSVHDEPVELARVPTAARFTTVSSGNLVTGSSAALFQGEGEDETQEKSMEAQLVVDSPETLALRKEAETVAALEADPRSAAEIQDELALAALAEDSEAANKLQGFSEAIDNPGP